MLELSTLKELYAKGYVPKHMSFTLESTQYSSEDELIEKYIENLNKYYDLGNDKSALEKSKKYFLENNQVFAFYLENKQPSVAAFYKLKDKYEDSTFVEESEREMISQLTARKSTNDEPLHLGSIINYRGGYYRVIWETSGFYMYNDMTDEIVYELNDSDGIIRKIA